MSRLEDLLSIIPTQTRRTEATNLNQQFSTPPTIAFILNWVANIKENDRYLEPSAGNGGLAVFGKLFGAKQLWANEIDETRRNNLKTLNIFDDVFSEDAEYLNDVIPQNVKPSVIVMNPPFSQAERLRGKKDQKIGTKHIETAFERLEDNGRLVVLVGHGMKPTNSRLFGFFSRMASKGNLRANIEIPGKEYSKYGTSFTTRMLVFDKTNPDPGNKAVESSVQSLIGIVSKVESVRNERIIPQQIRTEPGSEKTTQGKLPTELSIPPETSRDTTIRDSDNRGASRAGTVGGGILLADTLADEAKVPVELPDRIDASGRDRVDTIHGRQELDRSSRDDSVIDDRQADEVKPAEIQEVQDNRNDNEQEEFDEDQNEEVKVFDTYQPRQTIKGSQPHLAKLVESSAMVAMQSPKSDYQPSLLKKTLEFISDTQAETIIMAGSSFRKILPNGLRQGFSIGDGTGVGKGRTIAAIILDHWNQGHKKAVWLSENISIEKDTLPVIMIQFLIITTPVSL